MKQLQTKVEFDSFLKENASRLVVIDFTATWCCPCQKIAPFFEALSQEYKDAAFAKVDIDENPETKEANEVYQFPCFMFFKNGKKVHSFTGAYEDQLRQSVQKYHK